MNPDIIFNYLQKKSTEEEYVLIEQWIKDPENKKWLFEMEALWNESSLKKYAHKEYLYIQWQKTWDKINTEESEPVKRKSLWNTYFFRYAAAACVLIAVIGYYLIGKTEHEAIYSDYAAAEISMTDSARVIVLPDQSKVWLNRGSTIRLLNGFGENERRLTLVGEAYFEVHPDSARPFRVQTDAFTVKVLGTSFNVEAYPNDDIIEASLLEGKVVIEDSNNRELLMLAPGQKVKSVKGSHLLSVKESDANLVSSWRYGFISFENATLKEVVSKLEMIYSVSMEIDASSLDEERTYTGAVMKEEQIEQLLDRLGKVMSFQFRYDRNKQKILISQSRNSE